MLSYEELKIVLQSDWIKQAIPTDVKRVIIPLPMGVVGETVTYVDWKGKKRTGNGFLFNNPTDKRIQYLDAKNGVIIGYEGECPEGKNNQMISRSLAIKNYLKKHPNALKTKNDLLETIQYFQNKIFKHATDVTKWDENADVDMWTSDIDWLVVNFDEKDIFYKGKLKNVISATKKTAILDAIYFGPNLKIEGIGETSPKGSWVLSFKGKLNLITKDAFNSAYKIISKRKKI